MSAKPYNQAGREVMTYWQACDDPCGYVTDTPNAFHLKINAAVEAGLQKVTEISEADVDTAVKAKAWQTYNLARELAASVNRANEGQLALLCARIRKVVDAL